MVFRNFILQALIILAIIRVPFVSASFVSTIIQLETETVVEVVTVTVFIPLQTSPPFVDVDQQPQQLTAFNKHDDTKSAQSSSDFSKNISSVQNFQNNTKTPEKPTAQDDTINNLSSPNDSEAGNARIEPVKESNNKTIEETPKNTVTLPSNEVPKAQALAIVPVVSKDEEVQEEAEKSLKIPPAVPEVPIAREPAAVTPELSDKEEAVQKPSHSPSIPEVPEVPEVPIAREPAAVTPELSDKEEAVQKPSPSPSVPEVPEVPITQDPPKVKEIPAPPSFSGANGDLPNQASPILINSPKIVDTPKSRDPQSSRESEDIKDNSPKKVPQVDENTNKFLNALSDYESTALKFHNLHRTNHTSSGLSWNSTLAKFALATAKTCVFEHDFSPGDGNYGQNLAVFGRSIGVKSLDKSDLLADSITNKWYNTEFRNVLFGVAKPPLSGPQFLHLTQVIWKDTKTVGCATYECPRGSIFSFPSLYTVCDYFPAGNVLGQFDTKVNRPLGEETVLTTAFA